MSQTTTSSEKQTSSVKLFFKKRVPPRLWSFLGRVWYSYPLISSKVRETSLNVMGSVFLLPLRFFPISLQATVKERLNPVGTMDYKSSRVKMSVNTAWQHYRLKSAAKEPETIRWIHENMKPGDVFYDIGANIGAYSLVACAIGGSESTIYAFEPAFETYRELCENIRLNRANQSITPFQIAVGKETRILDFLYSDLRAGAAQHPWSGDTATPGQHHAGVYSQKTSCFRLDDFVRMLQLKEPSLMKIDVDGPEHEVLLGSEWILESSGLRTLLIEIADTKAEEICGLLQNKKFVVDQIHRRGNTWCNYIFKKGK